MDDVYSIRTKTVVSFALVRESARSASERSGASVKLTRDTGGKKSFLATFS